MTPDAVLCLKYKNKHSLPWPLNIARNPREGVLQYD